MKHPFDDFLPPMFHAQREDQRLIRIGIVLVAVVLIATAAAFATTLSGWRGLLENRRSVSMRWVDAQQRVHAFVNAQKKIKDSVETAENLVSLVDSVPRSILIWELTSLLPEQSTLNDFRIETRIRTVEKNENEVSECITLLGVAQNDASISSYIDGLSSSRYFTNVSMMYAQQEGDTTDRKFSIQLEVNVLADLAMEHEQ